MIILGLPGYTVEYVDALYPIIQSRVSPLSCNIADAKGFCHSCFNQLYICVFIYVLVNIDYYRNK